MQCVDGRSIAAGGEVTAADIGGDRELQRLVERGYVLAVELDSGPAAA